ncbi:MAG TPA: protein-glutamate O-methyltransferase CheR [Polyangiaceae bacterium]|jgi:chemotaxis protein methyltransferase CheR|nr:protein-glutamate O-methyltransferase CheR [Polyangiaceae bacterium]
MVLPLSPQVFAITNALIEEKTGIRHDAAHQASLAGKLSLRAAERGFESLLDYYYCLRYDDDAGAEMKALVETLVVQETYFFREAEALGALIDVVLAEAFARAKATGGRVRLWSAACATGEEPLTLAMMLDQRRLLERAEIIASDISARGLERARAGIYGGRALRAFPRDMRDRYTRPAGDERVALEPYLVRHVDWRLINLIEPDEIAAVGVLDAVICRNVLIYFGDEACGRVATSLRQRLTPEGVLLVGASESLLRFGSFDCEERGGAFFYRTPAP